MRVGNLDVGVERITRWEVRDEFHLPEQERVAPAFLPQRPALDAILRRPSLDERLVNLLRPGSVDSGLVDPVILSRTRRELLAFFSSVSGDASPDIAAAAAALEFDGELEEEVRAALALLVRG